MKTIHFLLPLFSLLLSCNQRSASVATVEKSDKKSERSLVWSDEFDGSGSIDTAKWDYDIGGGGWGNGQLEFNSNRPDNARLESGKLVIEAVKEAYEKNDYTSARLVTRGRASWTHVRVEVNAKLPSGRGTWPAIWMLGDNISEVGWPNCGEIDIMEHIGSTPDTVYGTVHTDAYNHTEGTEVGGNIGLENLETDFHTYFIDWTTEKIDFGIEDTIYFTFTRPDNATVAQWPFDAPQYLILNLAVGGNWGSRKGVDKNIWPQRMEVDWVRVYQ